MTSPRTPGFTAEAAVAGGAGSYLGPPRRAAGSLGIVPAALPLRPPRGTQPCDPTCLCVTDEGCPCCQSLPPVPVMWRRGG
jgi:hypothetical protein